MNNWPAMLSCGPGAVFRVALVVADHRSGEILASVGSAGFLDDGRQGFVDMSRALRSPGSTLKPLVYGLAFDAGIAHPDTLIDDRPTAFGTYAPQNFDGAFRGTVKVRDALKLSAEPAGRFPHRGSWACKSDCGFETCRKSLRKFPGGRAGLAVALGGLGVSLEDMVGLYAGLANGGIEVQLRLKSETILAPSHRIISAEAGVASGRYPVGINSTGRRSARAASPGKPAPVMATEMPGALGWDGAHVVGVWIGRPDGTPVPGAFGAELAAPLLFDAFARIDPMRTPLSPPAAGNPDYQHRETACTAQKVSAKRQPHR